MFDLKKMQKKGAMQIGGIDKAIGITFLIVIVASLAPTMFETKWSAITGAPAFIGAIMPLVIGIAVFYIIWKPAK